MAQAQHQDGGRVVKRSDLPVTCPPRQAKWDLHPRVYLPVPDGADQVSCPYCGATYKIIDDGPAGDGRGE